MGLTDNFNKDHNTQPEQGEENSQPENNSADYFEKYVGEGKKFSSPEEAVRALGKKADHADSFIEELKKEKRVLEDQYKEVLSKVRTQEEIFEAIYSKEDSPKNSFDSLEDDKPSEPSNNQMSQEDIANLVERKFVERMSQQEAETKLKTTMDNLIETFGSKEEVQTRINDFVGDSDEKKSVLDTLALADPEKLVLLLNSGTKESVNFAREGGSDLPNKNNGDSKEGELTWSMAKKIRQENPSYFSSIEFQRRLNNAVATVENFYKR